MSMQRWGVLSRATFPPTNKQANKEGDIYMEANYRLRTALACAHARITHARMYLSRMQLSAYVSPRDGLCQATL
jgi:hypothetical protein